VGIMSSRVDAGTQSLPGLVLDSESCTLPRITELEGLVECIVGVLLFWSVFLHLSPLVGGQICTALTAGHDPTHGRQTLPVPSKVPGPLLPRIESQ